MAVSLAKKCQLNVGLLDADVYGPSVPMMMKLHGKPDISLGDSLTVRRNKCFIIFSDASESSYRFFLMPAPSCCYHITLVAMSFLPLCLIFK